MRVERRSGERRVTLAVGILASLVCIAAGLAVAIMAGASLYAGWRSEQRRTTMADPFKRPFYGEYRSPFPWHRAPTNIKPVKKDSAA